MAAFRPGAFTSLSFYFGQDMCDAAYRPASLQICGQIQDQVKNVQVLWQQPRATAGQSNAGTGVSDADSIAADEYRDILTNRYWNQFNAKHRPACIALPQSADAVSGIMRIISSTSGPNDAKAGQGLWAVRGGGFGSAPYGSSTVGGVLIDMSRLADVTYDKETGLVSVGAGATTMQVVDELDNFDVGFPAGRDGEIGVAGYLLEGGISWFSNEFGLAADSVRSYDLVLANGTAITVDASNRTDPQLFQMLKGFGTQMGIVTKFVLQALPINDVSTSLIGGQPFNVLSQMANLQNFTEMNTDPKAGVSITYDASDMADVPTIELVYNSPSPPADAYAPMAELIRYTVNWDKQRFRTYLEGNRVYVADGKGRYLWRGVVPNLPDPEGGKLYTQMHASWKQFMRPLMWSQRTLKSTLTFRPLSKAIVAASNKRSGGNAFGWKEDDGDFVLAEFEVTGIPDNTDFLDKADKMWKLLMSRHEIRFSALRSTNAVPATQAIEAIGKERFRPDLAHNFDYDGRVTPKMRAATSKALEQLAEEYDPNGTVGHRSTRKRGVCCYAC